MTTIRIDANGGGAKIVSMVAPVKILPAELTEEQRRLQMLGMPVQTITAHKTTTGDVVKVASDANGEVIAAKLEPGKLPPWMIAAAAAGLFYLL